MSETAFPYLYESESERKDAMRDNQTNNVWYIYFVGYDDTGSSEDAKIEAFVGRERIETTNDPKQIWEDASMAALLRGGEVLTVIDTDDEQAADAAVRDYER